jgi:hypothetical protein
MLLGGSFKEGEMGGGMWYIQGEKKYIYRILVGKPVGRRQLGRTRHRWESNIEMDHK